MRSIVKDALTEKDNETYCAIRIIGFAGVALVGAAIVVGAAPLEVGARSEEHTSELQSH